MSQRTQNFGPSTTADEVLAGLDLQGKTAFITGGTSGLGEETARALAAKGVDVTITSRNAEKTKNAVNRIKESTGVTVNVEDLELGSFDSIRALAKRILQKEGSIDILILNAAVMACPHQKTNEGFEMQFGTNHLGHFLLTCLIAGKVSDNGRIVSVSSSAHHFSPVVFEDVNFENREYSPWASYGQSKTANALFAVALNKRLAARGIDVIAMHPGVIVTELARHLTDEDQKRFKDDMQAGRIQTKNIPAGAATQTLAATAPELKGKGGCFMADCQISKLDDESEALTVVRSYALNPEYAEQLWDLSQKLVGQKFDF